MFVRILTNVMIVAFLGFFPIPALSALSENAAVSPTSTATSKPIIVKLNNIKIEKTSEKGGDEIYFSITEYSSLNRSKESQLPIQPNHWLSKDAASIKDVTLWQGGIQEGEEIHLIFALLEQDAPPVDPDDLIGSAELIFKNKKGNISQKWKVPVFGETNEVEMVNDETENVSYDPTHQKTKKNKSQKKKETQELPFEREVNKPQQFIFKGEQAKYIVTFEVQNNINHVKT